MTALIIERMRSFDRWETRQFPLAVGNKAFKNASVGIDLSTGKVEPAHAESDLFIIGIATETVDATSVEKLLNVDLLRPIILDYWASAGGITAANIGSIAYFTDDNTVSLTPNGCVAGRIWDYSATRGVGVEKLDQVLAGTGGSPLPRVDPGAFASNDLVIASSPQSGTIMDIPTTAAASTVTLPAAAAEGTVLTFVADGTKNGHTVQYRDATGPVNLTAALTASKRHLVRAVYLNTKWYADSGVSP